MSWILCPAHRKVEESSRDVGCLEAARSRDLGIKQAQRSERYPQEVGRSGRLVVDVGYSVAKDARRDQRDKVE